MKNITTKMLILSLLAVSSAVIANESRLTLETGWLDAEVGSTGNVLGANVAEVESDTDSDITIIEVKLPIKNAEDFESIEVIGKKTQQPIKQKSDAEWIKNYEEGIYGLRLHLKKAPNIEFRIRLIDNEKD